MATNLTQEFDLATKLLNECDFYGVLVEVVVSSIKIAKENPTMELTDIIRLAMMEWDV